MIKAMNSISGRYREIAAKGKTKLFVMAGAIFVCVGLATPGFAFFSDRISNSVVTSGGCLQVTPTLKIDGAIGNRPASDWQSSATCIPARYTQVEYLAFSGTQHINTGVNQLGDTKVSVKFALNDATLAYPNGHIFGTRFASGNSNFAFIANNAGNFSAYWGTVNNQVIAPKDTNVHTAMLDNNKVYFDGTLKATITGTAPTTASNIFLAGFSSANAVIDGYQLSGKIYDFQISKSGALVRNMIPVFDGQTGMCGMYDLVSNAFFGNNGSGAIDCPKPQANPNCDNLLCNGRNQGETGVIVQPNTIHNFSYTLANTGTVNYQNYTGDRISAWIDSRYATTDYIQLDGNSYIDSGINQVGAMTVSFDFRYDTITPQNYTIFGARPTGANTDAMYISNLASGGSLRGTYNNVTDVFSPAVDTNRHVVDFNTSTGWRLDGVQKGPAPASIISANPRNIYIGNLNNNNVPYPYGLIGKVYGSSITKAGAPTRDYVPAYDKVTGQCGLYDKITNTFFSNAGLGTITCPAAAANPMKILLYPQSVPDATINAEVAAMTAGSATTSPSALATINGSACTFTFFGTDAGISPVCTTSTLAGTLGMPMTVGNNFTYNYKFVVWAPNGMSSVYLNSKIQFGVASGAQGILATGWKQQVHPYVGAATL